MVQNLQKNQNQKSVNWVDFEMMYLLLLLIFVVRFKMMDDSAGEFKFRWSFAESERFKGKFESHDNILCVP